MTNTTPAPRTRRQLREALATARAKELQLAAELGEANVSQDEKKRETARLRTDLAAAETKLHSIGYERSIERQLAVDLGIAWSAEVWQPKQGLTPTLTSAEHEKIVSLRVIEARADTRRSTLATVIDALELPYVAFTAFKLSDPGSSKRHCDTDRLWSDLQTALSIREADKHAETQRKIAEKVAGLTKPAGAHLTGVDIARGPIFADGAINATKLSKPVIDLSPDAAARIAEQISTSIKQAQTSAAAASEAAVNTVITAGKVGPEHIRASDAFYEERANGAGTIPAENLAPNLGSTLDLPPNASASTKPKKKPAKKPEGKK